MPDRTPARFALIASFTTPERGARGRGIVACRIDGGAWTPVSELTGLDNPSYLIADAARARLYVAHGDRNFVSALAIDRMNGALSLVGQAASGGDNGVHLALAPGGRFLIVANHDSGSLGLLPVSDDGGLRDCVHCLDLVRDDGRPAGAVSHPHQVIFDPGGAFLLVPDKGLDRVFTLQLDEERGRLEPLARAVCPPGSGPRHFAFHPNAPFAFVVNELDSSVAACAWDPATGVLTLHQRLSTLPEGFAGTNTAAAIDAGPDGETIHITNRGHDSLVRFHFDAGQGALRPAGWRPSGGATPRFMARAPDGRLIVANEQGDSLFRFDGEGGAGELLLQTPSPSCIAFL